MYGGCRVDGHTWGDHDTMVANSQPSASDPDALQSQLLDELSWLGEMIMDPVNALSGGIFTQPFDVEYENNGCAATLLHLPLVSRSSATMNSWETFYWRRCRLQTYDRQVTKIDVDKWRTAAYAVIGKSSSVKIHIPVDVNG